MNFEFLNLVSENKFNDEDVACVTLVHNEFNILADYFEHYRALGKISFIFVDDRSTDGSKEFLLKQPDVTLYQPTDDSTYSEHKRIWRRELMGHYSNENWCLVPDADEHFVFSDMENRSIESFIKELEAEGAEAVMTAMLDMYADKPLSEHIFDGGRLAEAFPYFDGQTEAYMSYRLQKVPRRYLLNYPTPKMFFCGGMRERLFYSDFDKMLGIQKWFMRKYMNLNRSLKPNFFERIENSLAKFAVKNLAKVDAYNNTKLGLIKWRKSARFSGGAHSVNREFNLSKSRTAFLHYKFTRGIEGLKYIASRGQHAGGGQYYKKMLDENSVLAKSPVFENTVRYENSSSLNSVLK